MSWEEIRIDRNAEPVSPLLWSHLCVVAPFADEVSVRAKSKQDAIRIAAAIRHIDENAKITVGIDDAGTAADDEHGPFYIIRL